MRRIHTDLLVAGSGIAGLTFALKAAEFARVLLVTKKNRVESATNYAQGGVAAVFGEEDAFGPLMGIAMFPLCVGAGYLLMHRFGKSG